MKLWYPLAKTSELLLWMRFDVTYGKAGYDGWPIKSNCKEHIEWWRPEQIDKQFIDFPGMKLSLYNPTLTRFYRERWVSLFSRHGTTRSFLDEIKNNRWFLVLLMTGRKTFSHGPYLGFAGCGCGYSRGREEAPKKKKPQKQKYALIIPWRANTRRELGF